MSSDDPRSRLRVVMLPPTAVRRDHRRGGPGRNRPGGAADPATLIEALAGLGIDVTVIDPAGRPLNPLAGRGSVLTSLDPWRALRVLLAHRRADIVLCVFEGAALPLLLLRRFAAFAVPCVVWDVGLTEGWKLRERILDRVIPGADAIFVLSASQQAYIARRWGRARGVEVLGHRVDAAFFTPAEPAPQGPLLVVGDDVGRDFSTLLQAVRGLDAPVLIKTGLLADDAALPPNVTILRERLDDAGFRALYQRCRFVVVPLHVTLNASGVSTILEAGAMGRAAVVSDNPAIRDFIVADQTCLVVPCGDAAALRTAILRLLHDPATCAALGAGARRFVDHHASLAAFAPRLAMLLRRYAR